MTALQSPPPTDRPDTSGGTDLLDFDSGRFPWPEGGGPDERGSVAFDRLEALAACGALDADSLLEVGCGTGELLSWLNLRGYRGGFTGVCAPDDLFRARSRHPDATFLAGDPLIALAESHQSFDFVFLRSRACRGPMDPLGALRALVHTYWPRARKGLVIDWPNAWADYGTKSLRDLAETTAARVELRDDGAQGLRVFLYR